MQDIWRFYVWWVVCFFRYSFIPSLARSDAM